MNSDNSILRYLEANCGNKARESTNFRKRLIDFLKELLIFHKEFCQEYLESVKNISMTIYIAEQSLVVKEKILSFLAKFLLEMETSVIEKIFKPLNFIEVLLDEIKLKKLAATVKGAIWYLIGILYSRFPIILSKYKKEINDVIFYEFNLLLNNSKKMEFKAVIGIMKSYMHLMEDNALNTDEIKIMYAFMKSLMIPLDKNNSIKINKCK